MLETKGWKLLDGVSVFEGIGETYPIRSPEGDETEKREAIIGDFIAVVVYWKLVRLVSRFPAVSNGE